MDLNKIVTVPSEHREDKRTDSSMKARRKKYLVPILFNLYN